MYSSGLTTVVAGLFREWADGPPGADAFIVNRGDAGLLAALDRLSSQEASQASAGGATVAAHAAHVAYGLSLMNRWANGENPFENTDWATAWTISEVTDAEWKLIRSDLQTQCEAWMAHMEQPREVGALELSGMVGSVAHFAYHMGALRQIEPRLRGPREGGSR